MKRILVDHARARLTGKRGDDFQRTAIEDAAVSFSNQPDVDLIAPDEALGQLAKFDEQQSRVVELKILAN